MNDIINLQKQIDDLKNRLNNLDNSSSIPRNVETAFKERLGLNTSTNQIISGTITTDGSGNATISNGSIKATSVICITANGTSTGGFSYAAYCTVGTGHIYSTGAVYQNCQFFYIIIV